jgi:predicted transcriptional regulator
MTLLHPRLETNTGKIARFLTLHPGAYGLEIARGAQVTKGGLYTSLARMEQAGMIVSTWGASVLGARRKHYYLRRPR